MHRGDFDLPDWARWIATDADGAVWAYEVEPLMHDTGWYENEVGRRALIGRRAPPGDWRDSLKRATPSLSGHQNESASSGSA